MYLLSEPQSASGSGESAVGPILAHTGSDTRLCDVWQHGRLRIARGPVEHRADTARVGHADPAAGGLIGRVVRRRGMLAARVVELDVRQELAVQRRRPRGRNVRAA